MMCATEEFDPQTLSVELVELAHVASSDRAQRSGVINLKFEPEPRSVGEKCVSQGQSRLGVS
jgi:hypothetical protein